MPERTIAEFRVTRLEILSEDGTLDEALAPDLGRDELVAMYRAMVRARLVDERMLKLQRQGRVGTFPPCTGHEAATVAPALAMRDDDWFVGNFRETPARLALGEPIVNQLVFYGGYEEGNVQPPGGRERLLPISILVGSQLAHAVGIAYATKLKGEDAAVVSYVGDGGTSEGDFHEALNLASVWRVPVVFIVLNNQWAISVPLEQQTRSRTLAQKAIAYEMPGVQVDGNDALAMYRATADALERARAGDGPTLIEAQTYRLMMHTTADDPKKYRSEEQVERWWKREPLGRLRKLLEARGWWDEARQSGLEAELRQEVDAAVEDYESRAGYSPEAPFDNVFGTRHQVLEEQRREFLAELAADQGGA